MSKRAYFGRWRGSGKTAPVRVAFSRQLRKAAPRLVTARPDTSERFAPQGYGHCRQAAFVMEHEDDKSIEYRVDPYADSRTVARNAPNRSGTELMRLIMRGTMQSCLSLIGRPVCPVHVRAFVRVTEEWLNSLKQPPNFVAAGFSGKVVSFARAGKKLQEASMEHARWVTLLAMPPGDKNVFAAPVSASLGADRDVLLSVDTSVSAGEIDWLTIAKQIHSVMPFVYGYQYVLPYTVSPGMYTAGIVYSSSTAVKGHEEELRTRWSHVRLAPEKNPRDQCIRQVYPLQFLSDGHLRLPVGSLTLGAWIEAAPKRGQLRVFLPGLWTWSLPDVAAVQAANIELFHAGILSAWDPHLAQPAECIL